MTTIVIGPAPALRWYEMSEADWMQWRHHPISQAFLAHMGHLADNTRDAAMELWERGQLLEKRADRPEIDSAHMRGRVAALRELQTATLGDIQEFYRPDSGD